LGNLRLGEREIEIRRADQPRETRVADPGGVGSAEKADDAYATEKERSSLRERLRAIEAVS